jgi:hypothetical protein
MNEKSNYIAFLGFIAITIFFAAGAYLSFTRGNLPFAGLAALLSLLGIYRIGMGLKNGLRAPNRFEWFKYWMFMRPVLFGLIGLGGIALFAFYGRDWFGEALYESTPFMATAAIIMIAYLGLIIYFAIRAPFRRESDGEYKERIGWVD